MSVLAPETHTALSQLLNALATPDNTVRTQAEEQLNNEWVNSQPDVLLMGLAEQIQLAENASVGCPVFCLPCPSTRGEGWLIVGCGKTTAISDIFPFFYRQNHSRRFYFDG